LLIQATTLPTEPNGQREQLKHLIYLIDVIYRATSTDDKLDQSVFTQAVVVTRHFV